MQIVLSMALFLVLARANAQDFSPRSDAKAADSIFASIRASREIKIATDPTSAPYNHLKVDGYHGFEVDLAKFIGKEFENSIGKPIRVRFVPVNYDNIKMTVRNGHAHIGLNCLEQTSNRKEGDWGVYSDGYFESRTSLIYATSLGELTFEQIAKKRLPIGILNDGGSIQIMKEKDIAYLSYNADSDLFEALESGQVKYIAYDHPILVDYVSAQKGKYRFMKDSFPEDPFQCAALMSGQALNVLNHVNSGIKTWKGDHNSMEKIKKYFTSPIQ